jgi:hypothetical protein
MAQTHRQMSTAVAISAATGVAFLAVTTSVPLSWIQRFVLAEASGNFMWPTPPVEPSLEERVISDGPLYERGMSMIRAHLEQQSAKTGLACELTGATVSASENFPIIVRATVIRTIDRTHADGYEFIWEDKQGIVGTWGAFLD